MSEDESGEDPSSDPTEHDPERPRTRPDRCPARSAPRPAAGDDQGGPGESGRRCRERGPMIAIPSCSPTRSSDWWMEKGWTTEINVHTLLARWALLVGATNAAHSQPEGYSDTV